MGLTQRRVALAALALILLCGATLRVIGTNWDDGAQLHPDERYISTVADNLGWPQRPWDYFDVERSPLSPYNSVQGRSYIYGTLPLFATMVVAEAVGEERYGELNLVGRRLVTLLDTLTIVLVFLVARLLLGSLGRERALFGALLAAALYAFSVAAIQHSHFFTTDLWLVFFGMLTLLVAMRSLDSAVASDSVGPAPAVALLGVCLGLTIACKVSGALLALPVVLALCGRALIVGTRAGRAQALVRGAAELGVVLVTAYVAFRVVSPYTFAHSSWLELSINESLRSALDEQARVSSGPSFFPPSYQWMLSPRVWSPLENLALWQLGVPFALAALVGLGVLAVRIVGGVRELWRGRKSQLTSETIVATTRQLMIVAFVLTVFLYFGTRFGHAGRYLLPMVPLLAVAAAFGVTVLTRGHRTLWISLSTVLVVATALYAVAFDTIYTRPNTRIAASEWISENAPPGAVVANEHRDDALPVRGRWGVTAEEARELGGFVGREVPVFDLDDSTKLRKLYEPLAAADYYVLSSPRAWRTIGRLPEHFPLMARFYQSLFDGRLGYTEVKSFRSEPTILGIGLRDLRAEEAFWVYDHPPVRIFKREAPLRWDAFRAELCRGSEQQPFCA